MTARRRQSAALCAVAAIAVAGLALIELAQAEFVWEDHRWITRNTELAQPGLLARVFTPSYWNRRDAAKGNNYRPLRDLSFGMDVRLWGHGAEGFHVTNLLLHWGCVVALYWAAREAGANRSAGLLAAMIFGVFSAHTEAVAWIKARDEVLSGLLVLLGFGLLVRATRASRAGLAAGLTGATFFLFAAVLAKESALAAVPVLVLWGGAKHRPEQRRAWACWGAAVLLCCAGYMAFRRLAISPTPIEPVSAVPSPDIATWLRLAAANVKTLVWMRPLCVDHWVIVPDFGSPAVAAVSSLAWLGLCVVFAFRFRGVALLLAALGLLVLPPPNLGRIVMRPFAEQRIYLPSLCSAGLLGLGASAAKKRGGTLAVVLIVILSAHTIRICHAWRSEHRLFAHSFRVCPASTRTRFHLANVALEMGRARQAARLHDDVRKAGFVSVEERE